MERQAQSYVLDNIRQALTHANKPILVGRIASFENETGLKLTLENFIDHHRLELDDIYKKSSWSRLCTLAGVREDFNTPDEAILSKGLRRFCHNNSSPQLVKLKFVLSGNQGNAVLRDLPDETRLLLTMFCFSIWNNKPPGQSLEENIDRLKNNPALFDEAVDLISLLARRSETVVHKMDFPFVCPLSVHACYTRDEILSGLNFLTFKKQITIREGIKYLSGLKTDLLFITLNKTEKDYSPTTMYKDYALDENTFHWQSQSTTSDTSPTGQRYIHHLKKKNHVFLFVREQKKISNLACPYNFIGPATYIRHSGSRPMSIVWQLKYPMPARLFRSTMRLATA